MQKSGTRKCCRCHCGSKKRIDCIDIGSDYNTIMDKVHSVNMHQDEWDHPFEIMVDGICFTVIHELTEVYTTIGNQTDGRQQHEASIHVKVEIIMDGSVMPLYILRCLFPGCTNKCGHLTSLYTTYTHLAAYSGKHIPQFGALGLEHDADISWQRSSPAVYTQDGIWLTCQDLLSWDCHLSCHNDELCSTSESVQSHATQQSALKHCHTMPQAHWDHTTFA